mmetsp:Transcript_106428/g.200424  ORF Transcript_106428/g.200424 Transcript_106428/m.200424 type:complete len:176 (+) Transcript_106428:82-609(+)
MSFASAVASLPAATAPIESSTSTPSRKPEGGNKRMRILATLVPFLACLVCVVSVLLGLNTLRLAQKAACSLAQSSTQQLSDVHTLEEPSRRLKHFLCARVEAAEQIEKEKARAAEEAEQEALVQQWLEAEQASEEMVTKLRLETKLWAGPATGLAGVLGTLYFLGWWPSSVQTPA